MEEFDRVEILAWEFLVIHYHEIDGALFEGPDQTYVKDLVEFIEETFGLTNERSHEIVIIFVDALGILEDNRELWSAGNEIAALLSAELANSIDQQILSDLRALATSRQRGYIAYPDMPQLGVNLDLITRELNEDSDETPNPRDG